MAEIVRQFSLSHQTAGEKYPVIPTEQQDEEKHQNPWQTSIKKLKHSSEDEGDNTIPSSKHDDNTRTLTSEDPTVQLKTETTNFVDVLRSNRLADNLQQSNYENVDAAYTRIDDDLPSDSVPPSQSLNENKAILFEDKMVQVPEVPEDTIIEKQMQISKLIALPKNEYETNALELSLYKDKGLSETIPSVNQDPNEDHVVEIDCCKTYTEACCITFSCGIPILMKLRRARRDNTVTINPGEPMELNLNDFQIKQDEETDQQVKVCLKSFLNVFFLTITCGISGLIRDLRSRPPAIKSAPVYEELQPSPEFVIESPNTPSLLDGPATDGATLDCSKFTDTLCLVATCGLSRRRQHPSEQSTPETKAEPQTFYTNLDEVTYEEMQPLTIEVVDEANMPIVSFTATQVKVLQEIAPTVYASLAQYDPDDTSIRSASSCCTSCMNTCCQTCSCNITGIFSRNTKNKAPRLKKEELFTPTLQKASTEGGKMMRRIIFPLVLDVAREVWVALELATILIGLILSIATVSFNQNEVFNILHFILIVISSILAIVDAFYSLLECRSCKRCYSHFRKKNGNSETDNTDTGQERSTKPCLRCMDWCNKKLDFPRIIVTEVLVYPLLVCDIFEVIVGRGHEGNSHSDRLGFALFLLSCISLLLYVYIVRVLVLGRSIKRLHNIRSLEFRSNRQSDEAGYFAVKEALKYQLCFFVHVVMQMLAQMMMLIAIGGKIRYDNRHFYDPGNMDETIHYSGYLIVMLIIGYITPTMGYVSFFIVTKTWVQQFPVGVFNDMKSQLNFLKQGGPENFLSDSDDMNDDDEKKLNKEIDGVKLSKEQRLERVRQFMTRFTNDFQKLRSLTFLNKVEYPFKSPLIIFLCMLYAAMQLTFIICAGVAINDMGVVVSQVLNGGGWVVYYIFAIIFGAIANAYVLLVAGFWILVIVVITAILVGILFCIVLVFIILACFGSSSNSRREY